MAKIQNILGEGRDHGNRPHYNDISDDIYGGELPDGLIHDDATGAIVEAGKALFDED